MPNSQNGWPIIPDNTEGRKQLTNLALPGKMSHKVYVLSGDVLTIAEWHTEEYHKRVEPIKPAGCWGWNVRKIGNGPDWSNHSSATAWDLNAPDNPDGVPTRKVMTAAQIAECHKLEKESDNVLRWGGDWSDPDAMHWEIVGSRAATKKFANKLRGIPVGRTPVMQEMIIRMPLLVEGDRDDLLTGYDSITRMQRIILAKDDGWWGPKTTERIAEFCKLPVKDCKYLTEDIIRRVWGMSR